MGESTWEFVRPEEVSSKILKNLKNFAEVNLAMSRVRQNILKDYLEIPEENYHRSSCYNTCTV